MKKNSEFESLSTIQRQYLQTDLLPKIKQRIAEENKVYFSTKAIWGIAASFICLLTFNVLLVKFVRKSDMVNFTYPMELGSDNNLYK